MNIIFGTVSTSKKKTAQRFANFKRYIKDKKYSAATTLVTSDTATLAYTSKDGGLIGIAQKNGVTLLLYGFIYQPLPGWKSTSSSVEDSNVAAGYLLERYFKKGDQLSSGVYGHFSIIVIDEQQNKTLIIRDPTGQNDLFYYRKGLDLIFSNKIKAVASGLGDESELDRSYEDFFLIHGFYPENRSMYKNVMALPKQSYVLHSGTSITAGSVTYPKLPSAGDIKNEAALIDNLYDVLMSAMRDMLPSKKTKVAVLLGGFDSALVASMLKKIGMDVETFSFYYEDEKYNQLHTDTVADYLGIKHNWVKVDEKTIEDGLANFSDKFNQPTNWPSYVIQTAYLCEVIRKKGFSYCYTGDGCDALFYGYPLTFKRAQILSKVGNLPNPVLNTMIKIAERPSLEKIIGRPYQVGLGALRSAKRDESVRTLLTFRVFDELSLKQLRNDSPKQAESTETIISRLAMAHKGKSVVNLGYEGKKMVSPNKNKMNGSADISELVIASPYMHYLVGAFASTIPDELLRPSDSNKVITGKYILSKMAEKKDLLPHDVIYQPKIGAADSPIEDWYRGPLRPVVKTLLKNLPFVYKKSYVESLIKETKAERAYAKLLSKDTSGLVTLSHCISLLATYASFTDTKKR